jgi:hypothetical protein
MTPPPSGIQAQTPHLGSAISKYLEVEVLDSRHAGEVKWDTG